VPHNDDQHDNGKSIRISVSLPSDQHATLVEIAHDHKVSLAWVVRAAVEEYLANQAPLFLKEL